MYLAYNYMKLYKSGIQLNRKYMNSLRANINLITLINKHYSTKHIIHGEITEKIGHPPTSLQPKGKNEK